MTHDYMKSKLTGDPYGIVLGETQNKPGIMIEHNNHTELRNNSPFEEADFQIPYHVLQATKEGHKECVVLLSL